MTKTEKNQRAYDKRRGKAGKPVRTHKRREPSSCMQAVPPIMPSREWIDTPEDKAEVAAILARKGGAQ
jgi:hypothetical protein